MSFDLLLIQHLVLLLVRLNPFRTGRCLSTEFETQAKALGCLNTFRTGRCLSTALALGSGSQASLNPFRTGRCLSTREQCKHSHAQLVSIPFEQGDVFRRNEN